mgnify:CR=1 FL=1
MVKSIVLAIGLLLTQYEPVHAETLIAEHGESAGCWTRDEVLAQEDEWGSKLFAEMEGDVAARFITGLAMITPDPRTPFDTDLVLTFIRANIPDAVFVVLFNDGCTGPVTYIPKDVVDALVKAAISADGASIGVFNPTFIAVGSPCRSPEKVFAETLHRVPDVREVLRVADPARLAEFMAFYNAVPPPGSDVADLVVILSSAEMTGTAAAYFAMPYLDGCALMGIPLSAPDMELLFGFKETDL